jgi:hypothetical protein
MKGIEMFMTGASNPTINPQASPTDQVTPDGL